MAEYVNYQAETANERLDVFLTRKMELSRSHVQKNIAAGLVKVNDKIVKANYKLNLADKIVCEIVPAQPIAIEAENIPLNIVYEDEDIIVVNKARGMVVHPAAGVYTGTLVNALLWHCKDLSGINGQIRPGIVHRLDKDTSGVMVCAKNDQAHVDLAEQIRLKTAHRTYVAVVHGNIKENAGVIKGDIGRHPLDRQKMAIVQENGKPAVTHFKVLERFGDYTVVECQLETGRTHQIRVHMASIGHPLVNDPKYGPKKKSPFSIQGQALHSRELTLRHPVTKEEMTFSAKIPTDMVKIITALRDKMRKL